MKFLSWSEDEWFSRQGSLIPWDKVEHFTTWFGVTLIALTITQGGSATWILAAFELFGVGWEIKDGLLPYNESGDIQGFSVKDLLANNAGLGLAWLLASNSQFY